MNTMPPVVRLIATVLIGVPGGIMWVGGMMSIALGFWSFTETTSGEWIGGLVFLTVATIIGAIGFAMVTAVEILNGAKRYRMPSRRLPAYLGLEMLQQLLAVATVGVLLLTLHSLATGRLIHGGVWALGSAGLAFLVTSIVRTLRSLGRIWRAEQVETPPPTTHPL